MMETIATGLKGMTGLLSYMEKLVRKEDPVS